MSLITRCPSCLTAFQVTQSQLAQASGWVRCGRCDKIFNGAAHMVSRATDDAPTLSKPLADALGRATGTQDASDAPAAAPDDLPPPHPPEAADTGTPDLGTLTPVNGGFAPTFSEPALSQPDVDATWEEAWPAAADDEGPTEPTLDPDPAPNAEEAPHPGRPDDAPGHATAEPPAAPEPSPEAERPDAPRTGPDDLSEFDGPATVAPDALEPAPPTAAALPPVPDRVGVLSPQPLEPGDAAKPLSDPALAQLRPEAPPATAADRAEPSFVARARRRAFWNHRLVRTGLGLLALLLTASLIGQWALAERDRLAAEHPRWAPVLETLCGALNCTVQPYRNLNALAITSSSLKRLDDDAFEFDVGLRNRTDVAVAVPALELTLTDLSERVLVRRIIQPAELDAPDRLAAHGQWQGRHALVVNPGAGAAGVVNYKLQMFYP